MGILIAVAILAVLLIWEAVKMAGTGQGARAHTDAKSNAVCRRAELTRAYSGAAEEARDAQTRAEIAARKLEAAIGRQQAGLAVAELIRQTGMRNALIPEDVRQWAAAVPGGLKTAELTGMNFKGAYTFAPEVVALMARKFMDTKSVSIRG